MASMKSIIQPDVMVQQAFRLHRAGQLKRAHELYVRALKVNPRDPHAIHFLGVLMHQTGKSEEALVLLKQSVEIERGLTDAWCNLGNVCRDLGRHVEAGEAYDRALSLEPELAPAWVGLGNLHQQTGAFGEAISAYRRALKQEPDSVDGCYNLATVLARIGQTVEAEALCKKAISMAPAYPEPYGQLSEIYLNQNRTEDAMDCLRQGLKIDPRHPELQYNLGFALSTRGELPAARDAYTRALAANPDHAAALSALLYARRQLADWKDLDKLSRRLANGLQLGWQQITPFSFLAEPSDRSQQLACARLWTAGIQQRIGKQEDVPAARQMGSSRDGKLTIGYLSADYYRHPTAYLAAGLFEAHDRSQFSVIAYSNSRDDNSAMRHRLEAAFDDFVDIRTLSPAAAAERIHGDGVDILVDLKGHTMEAATAVMALRPASVQVSYLGYPGSMGAEYIDYIIGDTCVTPLADADDYDEHIVQMPSSYQVNDRNRPCPQESFGREALDLPPAAVVLCCFNNSWKITPEIFTCWMKILKAVPGSVLWLHGRKSTGTLRRNLEEVMRQQGVETCRLIMAGPRPLSEYLQLYLEADLFLDTLPYNAHTTASDALWMACPVLTVSGETFPSRVGASLLHAVGLGQLVCENIEEYTRLATELASDPDRLASLRQYLQQGRQEFALFDTLAFTRNLEQAYREMIERHDDGNAGAFRVET